MTSRRVLALRHIPREPLGLITDTLEARGIEVDCADVSEPAGIGPAGDFAGLILLGGPMSVNDPLPWIARELACISDAIARGKPVLGMCLGAQLIARALGGGVRLNPRREIGWFDVSFNPEARRDPLFQAAQPTETVFHWHSETFDLPAGAQLLASSERCRNQAFRWGRNVYGMQFHLEVTPEMIADWMREDSLLGTSREAEGSIDPGANAVRLRELAREVFGAWCDLL